jgi:hypothetical protein
MGDIQVRNHFLLFVIFNAFLCKPLFVDQWTMDFKGWMLD